MIKFGMNLLLWTVELSEPILPTLKSLKRMGYDGVEIPLFKLDLDYAAWGRRLDDLGLERTGIAVRTAQDDPMSADESVRQVGVDASRRALDCCRDLGATHLVGPLHSALGVFSGQAATRDEWQHSVDSIRRVAEHAGEVDVMLGIESLNRYESYLLNSQADATRFVKEVDHPNCRTLFDSFHANIEEKNLKQAIHDCADVLCHVHISENDRSTPGQGHVPWRDVFDGLHEVGYSGWLTIEAFAFAHPELTPATKIWRRMFENEAQLAKDGLAFMKHQIASRTSANASK
jgi:D-psicose/D-tagatose/L-ribulose 3-epimerase